MKVRKRRTERSQPLGPMVCRAVHSIPTVEQRTERERTRGQMKKQEKCQFLLDYITLMASQFNQNVHILENHVLRQKFKTAFRNKQRTICRFDFLFANRNIKIFSFNIYSKRWLTYQISSISWFIIYEKLHELYVHKMYAYMKCISV